MIIFTDNNLMNDYIIKIFISIFSLSFLQYKNIGMSSTQKTSCDRPLDSATPHPIKNENKKVTNNFYDLFLKFWINRKLHPLNLIKCKVKLM